MNLELTDLSQKPSLNKIEEQAIPTMKIVEAITLSSYHRPLLFRIPKVLEISN